MHSLYQRLKELDSDTFQRLCFHILKERHPGLKLRHVEGAAGDEGLDVFAGDLHARPAIWQCKSFPNCVGKSQKAKIKESLQTALKHFTPSYWILCLSVGMDTKTHRWFQRLQKSYASVVKIELLDNGELVHELAHRRSLRNLFFQGAVFDLTELRRIVTGTGDMSMEELQKVTDANLEDTIERWKERDARFNYQIVFDGDLGPPTLRQQPLQPGLVMSIWQGDQTVTAFLQSPCPLPQVIPVNYNEALSNTEGVIMPSLGNALQELREDRSATQLRLEKLNQAISAIESLSGTGTTGETSRPKRIISAASRRKMALAQKARWASVRKQSQSVSAGKTPSSAPAKRTMSASARRKIAAAQRARWAKVRAAKKK